MTLDRSRYLFLLGFLLPAAASAQLVVDDTQTPEELVQNVLLGQGVTAFNIQFNSAAGNTVDEQAGSFSNGQNTFLGIPSGLLLATGDVNFATGPNDMGSGSEGGGNNGASDPDLAQASGFPLNDAAVLEFDFIPTGDSLKFDFIFASDEYPEFACSDYNDVFGFFLSGPGISGPFSNNAANIALIPGTTVPIAINTVNAGVAGSSGDAATCASADPNWTDNSIYYIANGDGYSAPQNVDPHYVQYDGYTSVITARAQVICGQTYHIKIAVADAGDTGYDSAVFLKEGSFASTTTVAPQLNAGMNVNDSTMFEGCGPIPFAFVRTGDTTYTDTVSITIGGTSTAGVDYYPAMPIELIYQPGDTLIEWPLTVPLDADGIETLIITITQNVICSGQTVQSVFTFYIAQPDPLEVVTTDINGSCGQTHILSPTVSGGIGDYRFNWSTGETTPTIMV
ncbi:MAG TPA: choice-of-anchor L domain-containing protein, partial [Flavobacteriales bacterium]